MQNKAFSKILILIILIVFIGGGFWGWQYLNKDKTTNRQTYRNEEYGFEINCLGGWKDEWEEPGEWWAKRPEIFLTCAPKGSPDERFVSVQARNILPGEAECIQTPDLRRVLHRSLFP